MDGAAKRKSAPKADRFQGFRPHRQRGRSITGYSSPQTSAAGAKTNGLLGCSGPI